MNWKKSLEVSFFLFVISTMISQSAMDAFAVLSGVFLIGHWFQEKKSFPLLPKLKLEIPFLLFSLAVVLSFVTNWSTATLTAKRIIELKWILNFYLIVSTFRVLNPEWKSFQKVQIFIWISAMFAILTPLLGYDPLQGPDAILDRTPSGIARAGGFFSNPMTFSHLHAMILFVLVGISLQFWKERDKKILSALPLTILLGFVLLLSFTRGVWIGIFFALVLTGFLLDRRWGFRILAATLVLGLLGFLAVPAVQERALQFFAPGGYDSERLWIWKANWQIFLDHPLFGIGYGENTLALPEYYQKVGAPQGLLISHSHNQYLNILAGLGIFGLSVYLWLTTSFLVFAWKVYQKVKEQNVASWIKGLALGSIGAQVSFLIGGLTESNFEHSKVRYVLLIVWALPFWIQSLIENQKRNVQDGPKL